MIKTSAAGLIVLLSLNSIASNNSLKDPEEIQPQKLVKSKKQNSRELLTYAEYMKEIYQKKEEKKVLKQKITEVFHKKNETKK